MKYFGIGLGFSVLSKTFRDVTVLKPNNIHKLFNLDTLKPGLFTGTYVAVYEVQDILSRRMGWLWLGVGEVEVRWS